MAHVEVSCQRRTGHWLTIHGQQQASSSFGALSSWAAVCVLKGAVRKAMPTLCRVRVSSTLLWARCKFLSCRKQQLCSGLVLCCKKCVLAAHSIHLCGHNKSLQCVLGLFDIAVICPGQVMASKSQSKNRPAPGAALGSYCKRVCPCGTQRIFLIQLLPEGTFYLRKPQSTAVVPASVPRVVGAFSFR